MSTAAEADDRAAEAQAAEQPEKQNLFNDIFKVLKNSETHGSDLPGASN
jgi:membrane protein involved in colicin uptake